VTLHGICLLGLIQLCKNIFHQGHIIMDLERIFHEVSCIILHGLVVSYYVLKHFNIFLISFHLMSHFKDIGFFFLDL
jgi:hypothetical protein